MIEQYTTHPNRHGRTTTATPGVEPERSTTMDVTVKTKQRERIYRFVKNPPTAPKGLQRLIVLGIMRTADHAMSVREVADLAGPLGLTANAGVLDSVAWHLHQMAKEGQVALVNPFSTISQPDQPAAPAVAVIDFGL
jgi:hypothetical protein